MNTSLDRTASAALRQLIVDGEVPPGECLSQVALADRLGMSRTPLRIALSQLRNDGLLTAHPGGRFSLRSYSSREVLDAIELRGILEGAAAKLASERRTASGEWQEFVDCCATMTDLVPQVASGSATALERYVKLNGDFHTILFVLAASEALTDAYERLLALPFASPGMLFGMVSATGWVVRTVKNGNESHRAILDAIRVGEGAAAERYARAHVETTRRQFEAEAEAEPEFVNRLLGGFQPPTGQ